MAKRTQIENVINNQVLSEQAKYRRASNNVQNLKQRLTISFQTFVISNCNLIPPVDSFSGGFVSFQGLSRFSAIAIPSLHTTN